MRRLEKRIANNQSGFTLAELLIVVAIISVLIAVSIPIFTGKLDEAKKVTCEANCKSLKDHIVAEILGGSSKTPAELLVELQEKDDAYCPSGGTYRIYPSDKATVETGFTVVCLKHGGMTNLGDTFTRDIVVDTMLEALKNSKFKGNVLDSEAAKIKNSASYDFVQEIEKQGLSMKDINATSWNYVKGNDEFLYWTNEDIGDMKVGTEVPVMRYNFSTGTYTVWIAKITNSRKTGAATAEDTPYNVLDQYTRYTPSTSQDKEQQTYENAKQLFEQAKK